MHYPIDAKTKKPYGMPVPIKDAVKELDEAVILPEPKKPDKDKKRK